MKKLIVLFIFTSLSQFVFAQVKVTDFTEPVLKGHVKEVTELNFAGIKSINVDTSAYSWKSIRRFDEKGKSTIDYDYVRFNGGTPIKLKNRKYIQLGIGSQPSKCVYTYLGDTLITKTQYAGNDTNSSTKYLYKYNNGLETEFDTYISKTKILAAAVDKFYYKYDEHGNRTKEDQVNPAYGLMTSDTLLYDSKNQLIERRSNPAKFKESFRTVYQYDSLGNEIISTSYDSNGVKEKELVISYYGIDSNNNWLIKVTGNLLTMRYMSYY